MVRACWYLSCRRKSMTLKQLVHLLFSNQMVLAGPKAAKRARPVYNERAANARFKYPAHLCHELSLVFKCKKNVCGYYQVKLRVRQVRVAKHLNITLHDLDVF